VSWLDAVILGLIQGLTEFIPVSSSGHLTAAELLMPRFGQVGLLFDVMVHVGTVAAILVYYRRLLRGELAAAAGADTGGRRRAWRLVGLMLAATIPTGVIGVGMKPLVEHVKFDPRVVGAMELVTAAILVAASLLRGGTKDRDTMTWRDAVIIGIAQGLAVLPGLSRSGSTIGAGLILGLQGVWAADFAFLLAVPAILGAAGVEVLSALRHGGPEFFATADFARYLGGAAVAALVGYATIGFLIRMVATRRLRIFAIYCVLFGLVLIFVFP
jgi:undecaprenyl-diphosphatase